ncbi:hypothetical protein [Cryobacterium sp. BB736]|uniref:hypothetical protein n=1 Tax=Cryobacterium sp. BB736 TaxID=2746963 RepID=UPI00187693C0|nr:hypothetical protein [Cryobacterium sp. BB736]
MAITEKQVKEAFTDFLVANGWEVTTKNVDYVDLIARRDSELIVAELKGHTKSAGTAIDIGYGQLIRRMTAEREFARFALVVPETLATHVERVSADVRIKLGIEVYLVDAHGGVRGL